MILKCLDGPMDGAVYALSREDAIDALLAQGSNPNDP